MTAVDRIREDVQCTPAHACGYCLMVTDTLELLPRRSTAYEMARLTLALRVAREAVREALAPLTRRIRGLRPCPCTDPPRWCPHRSQKRSNGERGARA